MQTPAVTLHTAHTPFNALAYHAPSGRFGLAGGDGNLYILQQGRPITSLPITSASLLSLVSTPTGWLAGTDDGHLLTISETGETSSLAHHPHQFIEHLAYDAPKQLILAAVGKSVLVYGPTGQLLTTFGPLPSTVAGLALSPIGARLAVSHYGGVTIFPLDNLKPNQAGGTPRTLAWKGAHHALTYAPDGKWLISAMQEQALKIWRLSDGLDLQMRGYPGKITQFSWSHTGQQLGTNGGSGVPLWNFSSLGGPAGSRAQVLADSGTDTTLVSAVAMHPRGPFAAVGYTDGLVLLVNTTTEQSLLLHAPNKAEARTPCAHLAWSPDGMALALAIQHQGCAILNFADFLKP